MWALVPSLVVALSIHVPYLTQAEDLCGGAAVAMVLRYWGDAHADPREFAPLVDRRARGIPVGVLAEAVRRRGWRAVAFAGAVDRLRDELAADRPVIVLLQVQPRRYHFVVVTGIGDGDVIVHDPAVGPSQRMRTDAFTAAWEPAHSWVLLVLPPEHASSAVPPARAGEQPAYHPATSPCEVRLADAVEQVRVEGLDAADRVLGDVQHACPGSPGPVRELAGVRFAQRRWAEAASLARRAVAIDARDTYAWEVLASSRFVQDDEIGALQAWNEVGKPRIDSVRITGLGRTRHVVVADALALQPNDLLTAETFRRAARRLQQLPDQSASRIELRPTADGFAVVDAAMTERRVRPVGTAGWIGAALHAAVTREVSIATAGTSGQGELWSAGWRWWRGRPRVAGSFAVPRAGRVPGVWRVEGSWEAETYDVGTGPTAVDATARTVARDERTHGSVSIGDWLRANLRYEVSVGVDAWVDAPGMLDAGRGERELRRIPGEVVPAAKRHTATTRGSLERRLLEDRLALTVSGAKAVPLGASRGFGTAGVVARYLSVPGGAGGAWLAEGGVFGVTSAAPRLTWPGAGEGIVRAALLRAHPLVHDGVIGRAVFGRRLATATVERRQWIRTRVPAAIGVALFADAARAWHPLHTIAPPVWQVDLGAGLRVKIPGGGGTLRVDAAHGVRDGARALTIAWAP